MTGMTISSFGVADDHLAAFKAMLVSPLLFWSFWQAVGLAGRCGSGLAERWLDRRSASPLAICASAALLFASGLLHLALVPAHRIEEPGTALLFELDALLLCGLSVVNLDRARWRWLAGAVLVANVIAYLGYVSAGRETIDQLGIASKLIELTALGLLLAPARSTRRSFGAAARRFALAGGFVLLIVLTGATLWAVSARAANQHGAAASDEAGGVLTGMVMQPVPGTPPTQAQIEAANQFALATKQGIAKYANLSVALADGYRASTSPNAKSVHYSNSKYEHDGRVLDPEHPETLVYANTPHGPVLLGAMYQMPKLREPGPDFGGAITRWHVHAAVCFSPLRPLLVGLVSPFGSCPSGSLNIITPAMMHVWIVDVPGGPYSDLSPDEIAKLVAK